MSEVGTIPGEKLIGARVAISLASLAVGGWAFINWARLGLIILKVDGRYDFSTYYAAAYAIRHNLHANLYDAHVLAQAGAATHTMINPPLPYTYSPLLALALSPFTVLPFNELAVLWQLLNDVIWLTVVVVLAREIALILGRRFRLPEYTVGWRPSLVGVLANPVPLVSLALALLLCLPNEPAFQTVLQGQVNFLVLLPLALVPELERRGHPRWVGAMVAIAAMLKFTPVVLLLYFVLRRRWQVFIAGLVVLAGLAVLCAALVGPSVALTSVSQAVHVGGSDATVMHNEALLAPLVRVLNDALPGNLLLLRGLQYAVMLGIAFACGYVFYRWWRPTNNMIVDHEKDAAGYGMALCVMLLLWPTAWIHHYVWVLPAAAVALALATAGLLAARAPEAVSRRAGLALLTGLCCYVVVIALPHAWDSIEHPAVTTFMELPLRPLFLSFRALGTLGLLGILAYWYVTAAARAERGGLSNNIVGTREIESQGVPATPASLATRIEPE